MHASRRETIIKEKPNKINLSEFASLENSRTCLDDAIRLYTDSKRISFPALHTLVEIAIEELAKSIMLLTNSSHLDTL